ncbi:hypothetical protein H6503_04990 [Candidatus Woesearchaeota archaeon]|nr:hypothetical protein [Candidatus Woesearchaeota archaeon]
MRTKQTMEEKKMNAVVTTQPEAKTYFDEEGYLHFLVQERRHWTENGKKAMEIIVMDLPMSPFLKPEYHVLQVADAC